MKPIPNWLKEMVGKNKAAYHLQTAQQAKAQLTQHALHTVCEEARCPNRGECFNCGDATFMVLGDRCTRGCRFCAVGRQKPLPPDPDEPQRVADEIKAWKIRYAVLTMPTRDDLQDGGAAHFARVIQAIKKTTPGVYIEPLISDLGGSETALKTVLAAKPDVLAHNVETVKRLYKDVRIGADYNRTLKLLQTAKQINPSVLTKTGFMVGLGETEEEIKELLCDLRKAEVDLLTIGQYLSPSPAHYPVASYPTPADYKRWEEQALAMGFKAVASGPLVRSSYKAGFLFKQARLLSGK